MSEDESLYDQARVLGIQKHQLKGADSKLGEINQTVDSLSDLQDTAREELDELLARANSLMNGDGTVVVFEDDQFEEDGVEMELVGEAVSGDVVLPSRIAPLDMVDVDSDSDWDDFLTQVEQYAERQGIKFDQDPFKSLMSDSQRIALEKRIRYDFTLKNARCDKYDYMIAATCGLLGGLIDILFVGAPGDSALGEMTDKAVDGVVRKFAQLNGWPKEKAEKKGSDLTASAIGYLEEKYGVNYDQTTTFGSKNGTGGKVRKLSPKNHHLKSLGHSPDLIGLFFSILDQFSNQSHFVSQGKVIAIDTETFELRGDTFVAKVFCGFCNWFGHIMSDMAGSSGGRRSPSSGRGAGVPIPFFSLLQFVNVGEFGRDKQTFATICVRVFEEGYDLRHGAAMAVPVLVTELLIRISWVIKQRLVEETPWEQCIPRGSIPEVRRMLVVGHGVLCLVDTTDAAIKSGGEAIQFLLRTNLIGWVRFGTLAMKELQAWYREGDLDSEAVDTYLDQEYRRLLRS